MVYSGKEALLQGVGILERADEAYRQLTRRIAWAVARDAVAITLILTEGRPVEFSDGEYLYLRQQGVLIIRVNAELDIAERVRVFFRELTEFLHRCERGVCITQEVWNDFAPLEYNQVKVQFNPRCAQKTSSCMPPTSFTSHFCALWQIPCAAD